MDDPEELVTVYRAGDVTEAHFVKNLLLVQEIDVQVSEENEPFSGAGIVAPHVLVCRKDQARAEEVVRQYEQRLIERAGRPDWKCPGCRETVQGAYDVCWSCDTPRPDSS